MAQEKFPKRHFTENRIKGALENIPTADAPVEPNRPLLRTLDRAEGRTRKNVVPGMQASGGLRQGRVAAAAHSQQHTFPAARPSTPCLGSDLRKTRQEKASGCADQPRPRPRQSAFLAEREPPAPGAAPADGWRLAEPVLSGPRASPDAGLREAQAACCAHALPGLRTLEARRRA